MRTATNITNKTKNLIYVGCFAHDGSFLRGWFSFDDSSKSDSLAIPLHDIVACTAGTAMTKTVRI